MMFFRAGAGLIPDFPSPVTTRSTDVEQTEEAGVQPPSGRALHVTPLVAEGDMVAKGAAVACLRHSPDVCLVSPMAGRVARIGLQPGRNLTEVVVFRDASGGTECHDTSAAASAAGLRRLMQTAGVWTYLGRRPFGGMPDTAEVPAAIFVIAADSRPYAPDPTEALAGREESLARGIAAIAKLTEGPVFVCWPERTAGFPSRIKGILRIDCGTRHPQASVGIRIHQAFPAGLDAPVWDIHAEDVADLGDLLATGELPMVRRVRIAGEGLREGRVVRTHPGADLRQLTRRIAAPGPHVLMSGSHLDGRDSRWLGPRHRQVTVLPREPAAPLRHWLIAALTESAGRRPVIPTAALDQSLGAALPATPFIRALGAGDDEAAMKLGLLSLLEEDVALADYVLGAGGGIMRELRAMLDRTRKEYAL